MITLSDQGLFCEAGGFHIDPLKKVDIALITHAHSDHARRGSNQYYCVESGVGLLRKRLGPSAKITGVPYRKTIKFGSVKVSFHPAGHILGSAQIRVELDSKVWVASGDYKRDLDPTCEPFEVIPCDTFITEATFGHPKYEWGDTSGTAAQIYEWWSLNRKQGINSLLYCYALGKSQRVLAELTQFTNELVYVFGETHDLTECYRKEGVKMVPTSRLEDLGPKDKLKGELIVAPNSISRTNWIDRLGRIETAFASGWMQTGAWGVASRYDRGFVMSDHADWPALLKTIEETKARQIYVLHGEGHLTKHLRKKGLRASAMESITQGELF